MSADVQRVLDPQSKLGEGVLWDASREVVWFVDINRQLLWHFEPASGSNAASKAPEQIGWAIPEEGGRMLCGLKTGLHLFTPQTQSFEFLMAIPGEPSSNRLNDACSDPWGRVWFGSMDDGGQGKSGRFYVYDRGKIRSAGPSGIGITNGPAVSAQGDRIYFTDSSAQKIMMAKLDAQGVGEPELFVDTGAIFPDAFPDGPVVDAEDHLWTALYNGEHVARFSPDGELVETVKIPARDITKMAFGGADLKTAYVTCATKDMTPEDMKRHPLAGGLFAFESPVAGFAQAPVKLG